MYAPASGRVPCPVPRRTATKNTFLFVPSTLTNSATPTLDPVTRKKRKPRRLARMREWVRRQWCVEGLLK